VGTTKAGLTEQGQDGLRAFTISSLVWLWALLDSLYKEAASMDMDMALDERKLCMEFVHDDVFDGYME
jgi:hypothetical protein